MTTNTKQLSLFSGLTLDEKAAPPEKDLRIARDRKSFLNLYSMWMEERKDTPRGATKAFLAEYNAERISGVYEDLGPVSRSTLYGWIRDYREGGFDALIPGYSIRQRVVTRAEKRCLMEILADGIKVSQAIFITKYFLKRRKTESPSSPSTLRRWAKKKLSVIGKQ